MVSKIDWNGELELDATFSPYISCAKVFPVRRDSPVGLGQDAHQCLSSFSFVLNEVFLCCSHICSEVHC
jgi:hypothetical protein